MHYREQKIGRENYGRTADGEQKRIRTGLGMNGREINMENRGE